MLGRRWLRAFVREDEGGVTVEAALAVASLVTALVLCIGAVLGIAYQVRCHVAARDAARLTARGDQARAVEVRLQDVPLSMAVVTADGPLLPLLTLTAEAVAVREPEGTR